MTTPPESRPDAADYIIQHGIHSVLESCLARLIEERPENPFAFLREELRRFGAADNTQPSQDAEGGDDADPVTALVAEIMALPDASAALASAAAADEPFKWIFEHGDLEKIVSTVRAAIGELAAGSLAADVAEKAADAAKLYVVAKLCRVSDTAFAALFAYSAQIPDGPNGAWKWQLFGVVTRAGREIISAEEKGDPPGVAQAAAFDATKLLRGAWDDFLANPPVDVMPKTKGFYRGALYRGYGAFKLPLVTKTKWTYTSGSTAPHVARRFHKSGGTIVVILALTAVPIGYMSEFPAEGEGLLPPSDYILRDALPVSLLRLAGIRGEVQVLEQVATGDVQPATLLEKLAAHAQLCALFEDLGLRRVDQDVTPTDGGPSQPSVGTMVDHANAPGDHHGLMLRGSGGGGKTSAAVVAWSNINKTFSERVNGPDGHDDLVIAIMVPLCGLNASLEEYVRDLLGLTDGQLDELRGGRVEGRRVRVALFLDGVDELSASERAKLQQRSLWDEARLGEWALRPAVIVTSRGVDDEEDMIFGRGGHAGGVSLRCYETTKFKDVDSKQLVWNHIYTSALSKLRDDQYLDRETKENAAMRKAAAECTTASAVVPAMETSRLKEAARCHTEWHAVAKAEADRDSAGVYERLVASGASRFMESPILATFAIEVAAELLALYEARAAAKQLNAQVQIADIYEQYLLKIMGGGGTGSDEWRTLEELALRQVLAGVQESSVGDLKAAAGEVCGGDERRAAAVLDALYERAPIRAGRSDAPSSRVSFSHRSLQAYFCARVLERDGYRWMAAHVGDVYDKLAEDDAVVDAWCQEWQRRGADGDIGGVFRRLVGDDGVSDGDANKVRWCFNELSIKLDAAGRSDLSLPIEEQSVELLKRLYGESNRDTLITMNNLCNSYITAGRFDDAIKLGEATVEGMKGALGADHELTLQSRTTLSRAYSEAGRTDEALAMDEAVLKSMNRVLGADHRSTLISMSNLSVEYANAGRHADALALAEDALAAKRRVLADDDPSIRESMHCVGAAYCAVGRMDDAIAMFEATVAANARVLGDEHPSTQASLGWLVRLYNMVGRQSDAAALQRRIRA